MVSGGIHRTNIENLTSKLALGTVQFGLQYGISNNHGQTPLEEVERIFKSAKEYGIRILDTGQAYGSSEAVIGKLNKDRFEVVTKLNPNKLSCVGVKDLVHSSLEALSTSFLYGVLFHNAQSALENPTAVEVLKSEKEEGRLKKYGYSVYTPEELDQLIVAYGLPDLIQVPFSHLDRRFEWHLKSLNKEGVEIHTRSTFLQGLFFMEPYGLNDFFQPVKDYIHKLHSAYNRANVLAAFLLNFVIAQPFIDKVVIGVNDAQQLKDNLFALTRVKQTLAVEAPLVNSQILMPNLWPKG
jgi:aryl-alcohol dehydrogenase-like predicted oxidoreductase